MLLLFVTAEDDSCLLVGGIGCFDFCVDLQRAWVLRRFLYAAVKSFRGLAVDCAGRFFWVNFIRGRPRG